MVFDSGFVDALYAETSGHPFLTANVLVDLVDHLIARKRKMRELSLAAADFEAFRDERFTARRLCLSKEYKFFRKAIEEALGRSAKSKAPWLYCIYSILRALNNEYGDAAACSVSDYDQMFRSLGLEQIGMSSEVVLGTGLQTNFLSMTDDVVGIKIRMLGRLAGIAKHQAS